MVRVITILAVALLFCFSFSVAISDSDIPFPSDQSNLYKVTVQSKEEANRLASCPVEAVVRLNDAYLVLADKSAEERLYALGLKFNTIAENISKEQLAVDNLKNRDNIGRFELIFEEGQFRLFRIDPDIISSMKAPLMISPIKTEKMKIEFPEPPSLRKTGISEMVDLDSLISLINKDSLESYTERLQAFLYRDATHDSNYASRDWLASKFTEFGYDSVVIDSFITIVYTLNDSCQNVLAYKLGSRLPNHHVVIGAHRDAVPLSPGADDNGSGTAAVLEIARALKDIETNVTFVFALFDAEEFGLLGSWHYADDAAARGDTILFMLNMDMIAHKDNSNQANLFHGSDLTYANLWASLADSLVSLNTTYESAAGNSDHWPFLQNGYPAIFSAEYEFSTVYHSSQDSTTYMNFKYMRRMVQASLATGYWVSQAYSPYALTFDYPQGIPQYLIPGTSGLFQVQISGVTGGVVVPGSEYLHYSINGGDYQSFPLSEISPGLYEAVFPMLPCFAIIDYYITAEEEINGIFYDVDPSLPHSSMIIEEQATLFEDDFELDLGWSVYGDASEGDWERGIPIGGGDRGDPPADYDGSGSCFLTYNLDGNSDVDGGYTNLVSPAFDLSDGDGLISYARWYSNYLGYSQDDVFRIYISNDDGSTWTQVEAVGPVEQSSGGWYEHEFWAGNFVEPSAAMRLRFQASDLNMSSTVEAAVDAVHVTTLICNSFICGDANADAAVNVSDAVHIINYVFIGGNPPQPLLAGDTNCDSVVNVSDAVLVINYVFIGGKAPCDTDNDGIPDC